jgi:hypothetical protein
MLEIKLMVQYKNKQAVKIYVLHDNPILIWTDSSLSLDKSDDSRCYVVSLDIFLQLKIPEALNLQQRCYENLKRFIGIPAP